jgi:hypothetical protein
VSRHDRKRAQKYLLRQSDRREQIQRGRRMWRAAQKHGALVTGWGTWGVCRDCGCVGSPDHRCTPGVAR